MNFGQMNTSSDHRKGDFKKTVDASDGRRRRADTTLRIRKEKKEHQLKKKRDEALSSQSNATSISNSFNQQPASIGKNDKPTLADAPRFIAMLTSPDATEPILLEATRNFRRILSVDKNVPARELVNMGVLPYLVRNLDANSYTSSVSLIFESAWALTNIASTECTVDVVQAGAIKPLVYLLDHDDENIREQSSWCLGNIAGEGPELRDSILQEQPITPLIRNVAVCRRMSHMENVVWTISNLCRGTPSPPMHVTAPIIQPFLELLHQPISDAAKTDVLWALAYLSDGEERKLDLVVKSGVAPTLIRLLEDKKFGSSGKMPVVRILGNFVSGNEIQTQTAIDSGILNHLGRLLGNKRKQMRKESSWLASNIACGSQKQITMLVNKSRILNQIIENAKNDVWEVRKEALWAIANICTSGNQSHVMTLVEAGGLDPLVASLQVGSMDPTQLLVILEALRMVLEVGETFTTLNYVGIIEEYGGIDYLESLQTHPNEHVYNKVVHLIETYLGAEEESDENLAPVMNDSGTFGFGFAQGLASPKQLFQNFGEPESNSSSNGALPFGSVSTNALHGSTNAFYPV